MATAGGFVKKRCFPTTGIFTKAVLIAIKMREGDKLVKCTPIGRCGTNILLVTRKGVVDPF